MPLLGRLDEKPFGVDANTTVTYKDIFEFSRLLSRQLTQEIYLLPLANTAGSAGLYISMIESKASFVVCSIKEWEKISESLETLFQCRFPWICEKCLTKEGHSIGRIGIKDIYVEEAKERGSTSDKLSQLRISDGQSSFMCLSTSGSSGSPKLVKITKSNIYANTEAIIDSLELQESDISFVCLPLSYTYALSQLNTTAKVGGSAWITDKSVIQKEYSEELVKSKATVLAGVPYTYEMLKRLEYQPIKKSNLNKITQAGGRLPLMQREELYQLSQEMGLKFYIMYGQTEATARISCFCVNTYPDKIESVGQSLKNIRVRVSEDGELTISGPSVTPGYIQQACDFHSDTTRDIHYTGDVGRIDDDGFIFIEGRISRFSKISGKRHNLDVIERSLERHNNTEVYAVSDDSKLYVFSKVPLDIKSAELLEGIHRTQIRWMTIEEIPVGANGKVDYIRLARMIDSNEH